MNLFEMKGSPNGDKTLVIAPEAYMLKPFKVIWDRDKSKYKAVATKELGYVYYFSDLKSDYSTISNEKDKSNEIIKDLDMPNKWAPDDKVNEAIMFYKERSKTIISLTYEAAKEAADAINEVCRGAKTYINESQDKIVAASKVATMMQQMPKNMDSLSIAYSKLVMEQMVTDGRNKGSKSFNMFEDGLGHEGEDE